MALDAHAIPVSRPVDPVVPGGLAVVMPVLDEERTLADALDHLRSLVGIDEIVVVDGGSGDGTARIVRARPEVTWLEGPKGRARQMNLGAAHSRAGTLLFLHADVRLPVGAALWVRDTLARPEVVAGAFRTWTVPRTHPHRLFSNLWLHFADFRSRSSRLPYGDQALFLRRGTFERVGGFGDQAILEDLALSERLRELGEVVTVPACVDVDGRRFLKRPVYYMAVDRLFPALYHLGVPPEQLARWYGKVR